MIQMIGNKILITPDDIEETTDSGIILSKNEAEMPNKGVVISVGNKAKELNYQYKLLNQQKLFFEKLFVYEFFLN